MSADRARPGGGAYGAGDVFGELQLFTNLRHFDSIDSTNRYLLREAQLGAPEGTVAVADHQTAGRGRMGRRWEAPPGSSLLVSVLLRQRVPAGQAHLPAVSMALAAADACESECGVRPGLKWPNDLVVGERKLGGILSEAHVEGSRATAVVVGLGLNLRWPGEPPAGLRQSATTLEEAVARGAGERAAPPSGQPAEGGSRGAPVVQISRDRLLGALLSSLERRLRDLPASCGPQLAEYRAACTTLGKDVRVELSKGSLRGKAVGVDDQYRLVLDIGGRTAVVAAGDVVHVRGKEEHIARYR